MNDTWTPGELQSLSMAHELEIAVERTDGSRYPWTPIWVVSSDGQVYVRTWYRRDTGWYGHALRSHRARIRVPGLDTQVTIDDVSTNHASLRQRVDTAYRTKYGTSGSSSMVSDEAGDTTLRLTPIPRTLKDPDLS